MLLRSLCATALLVSTTAVPQPVEEDPVPKVICRVPGGYIAGTAFRVGPQYLITVGHVIAQGKCEIDGQPIKVAYRSAKADFAILEDERAGKSLMVDCNGYQEGRQYIIRGHARGLDTLIDVPAIALGRHYDDTPTLSLLVGVFTAQPGQSGGPIIDAQTGKVVGTTNTGDWKSGITGSVELKGTSICGGNVA